MSTAALRDEIEHSADPYGVTLILERVGRAHPGGADRIEAEPGLRAALIAVASASPWLSRLCATDPATLDVLDQVDRPCEVGVADPQQARTPAQLGRSKQLQLLHIAARDLLGLDEIEAVAGHLSQLARRLLARAWELTRATNGDLAVIGMGKLGGTELNYASDIDLLLVSSDGPPPDPRPFLDLARSSWRVDLDLRPEGRAGPLVRSLASYLAYWDRWAQTWEFQALLKARPVAGDPDLSARFEAEAATRVWGRPFGAEEMQQVRVLKARAEQAVTRRGLTDLELKRGKGGIRDIEFAVQLLQLVHGRADPSLRTPATLPAIAALSQGGYVASEDAEALDDAYRFLRTVEHRLQLFEGQQVHTVPAGDDSRIRLARVMGYRDRPSATALSQFDADLRQRQTTVRWIHERLFFRPLLEAFTATTSSPTDAATAAGGPGLTADAITDRLRAFGFADAERTLQAVRELTRGLSRSSRLMGQLLPMLLDWLSHSPDPDLGLLGLRTLVNEPHCRDQLTALCRESPEAARQLCQMLGTGPRFARDFQRHPDLLAGLATGDTVVPRPGADFDARAASSLGWRTSLDEVASGLRLFAGAEALRIAARDVLQLADVAETGQDLTNLAESVVRAALRVVDPPLPFAVAGMGRLGGREMAYHSDLDLLFVYDRPAGMAPADAAAQAESVAADLVRLISGSTPATGVYRVDTALRPEGRQGPQARSIDAYRTYYERWAQVWERQALLRGRFVAGDAELGRRFADVAAEFVWDRPLTASDVREIRRTKARIERERVPPTEDPAFHLKLGPGSLSDIEWTAELLQLQHGVRQTRHGGRPRRSRRC